MSLCCGEPFPGTLSMAVCVVSCRTAPGTHRTVGRNSWYFPCNPKLGESGPERIATTYKSLCPRLSFVSSYLNIIKKCSYRSYVLQVICSPGVLIRDVFLTVSAITSMLQNLPRRSQGWWEGTLLSYILRTLSPFIPNPKLPTVSSQSERSQDGRSETVGEDKNYRMMDRESLLLMWVTKNRYFLFQSVLWLCPPPHNFSYISLQASAA